ncbi:protein unc-93 homolog A-like [Babylonia areolata]|uniref:protein unc-93 homolog A-like n=1 Tax=Babylonia areolata TaxID=304850 RepID=UPI003FCF48A2
MTGAETATMTQLGQLTLSRHSSDSSTTSPKHAESLACLKKTNIIGQDVSSSPSISNGDFTLEVVEDFTYRSSTISSNLSLDAELNKRTSKAATAMARLAKRVWNNPMLTISTKMQVYQACVLSTLLYGSETWNLYSRQERRLSSFHLCNLRRILAITWQDRVPNKKVLDQAGISSMFAPQTWRSMRWLGQWMTGEFPRTSFMSHTVEFPSGSPATDPVNEDQIGNRTGPLKEDRTVCNNAAQPTTSAAKCVEPQRVDILKNTLVLSIGFLFLFTAFQSWANLQTSVNIEGGVGAYSLFAVYASLTVSCVFLPKFMIVRMGCKWTIPFCMVCYATYMAANFYPVMWLMTLTGAILGLGSAPMWSAKCAYLTQLGVWYSSLTELSDVVVINKFFGFFFMVFQTSQVWGNLISSTILKHLPNSREKEDMMVCGANFVASEVTNYTRFEQPAELVRSLCIIYFLCAVVAVVIVSVLLDSSTLGREMSEREKQTQHLLKSTLRQNSSPIQVLLIPITIYSGVEQAFFGADYSQSYVSCVLGVAKVGYVFTCFGLVNALCSLLFGRLVQSVGHVPVFVLALVVHGTLYIILLLWTPEQGHTKSFYLVAAFWGMGDAVVQTQINAVYGTLFTDNSEAAFSNYRLWESIGFGLIYAIQHNTRTINKLYICIIFLLTGMLGFGTVGVIEKRKLSRLSK